MTPIGAAAYAIYEAAASVVAAGLPIIVAVAGLAGGCFGLLHGFICRFPRVNDMAVGIALMLLQALAQLFKDIAAVRGETL